MLACYPVVVSWPSQAENNYEQYAVGEPTAASQPHRAVVATRVVSTRRSRTWLGLFGTARSRKCVVPQLHAACNRRVQALSVLSDDELACGLPVGCCRPSLAHALDLYSQLLERLDGVRQNLVDKGLVLDRLQRAAAIAFPLALHGGLLAFAAAKAVVGAECGKPIGFLLLAMVATIVVMVLFTVTAPKLTSSGKSLLAKLEKQVRLNPKKLVAENQSDAYTIDNSAMLWSTAFLGAAALSTAPWTHWRAFLDSQHRVSSSSSGGCSTSGCGGDSGCGGGGCGGCGGD